MAGVETFALGRASDRFAGLLDLPLLLPASRRAARAISWSRARVLAAVLAVVGGVTTHRADGPRDLTQPIVFASSEVFFPYQFRDRDGQLKGFANDVADAVARAMNLPIQRVALPNSGLAGALRTGRVDVLQFWAETPERHQWADFSVPIARFETVAIVRKDDTRIQQLKDLAGKRVGIGQAGTVGHRYLRLEQPEAIPVYSETSEEFLRLLSAGEIDAAVMSRLTAVSMIDRFGLGNLRVLDDPIPGDAYDVRYCFTVRKGDSLLLARLNEGLAIIHRTGEFDTIYQKWFGRYEPRRFTALELVSYVAAALALACIAVTWGLLRQRTLSRRVTRQAAEIAEQRSLLAALFNKHPLATVILEVRSDGELLLVSANAEAARVFDLDPKLTLPVSLRMLPLGEDVRDYFADAVNRWKASFEATQWESKLLRGRRILEAALVPLGGEPQVGQRICILSSDVTQRRVVEHELAQSRRLRALGELVGGIAHEFNNLLTPIIMTTSQTRVARVVPPQVQSDYAVIDSAARRAAELTSRLLTFGRKNDERPAPVLLREAVENCFALLRSTIDRRVEWCLSAPPQLGPLLLNPIDLSQIVFNLIINARDTLLEKLKQPHRPEWTPRLSVSIQEMPPASYSPQNRPSKKNGNEDRNADRTLLGWQRLTVEDNGMGIPAEVIDRIFEPFFTTKDVGHGTGLGLATVWHLVGEAGGDITVDSVPGEGSRFHVTLPRWEITLEMLREPQTPPPALGRTSGLRILLAEDDPLVSRVALAVLERAAHVVTHCVDGADAWSRLDRDSSQFDVLLLDLNMPRLNGIDLLRRVRASAYRGAIVVISGRIADEDRETLQLLRVDQIIGKPFSASDLIDALRALPPIERH